MSEAAPSPPRGVAWLGTGLGVAQLIAWGTIYYAVAVLGEPMQRDLGLSRSELYGMFTWSLALSGLLAPWAGRLVDRIGGRKVLTIGAVLGAIGFVALAMARSAWTIGVGWTIQGVAMALGLYDTCFAAVGQAARHAYRRAVTAVTVIAGLASSFFWPISHHLVTSVGWRATCLVSVALLVLCAPIYLVLLPAHVPLSPAHGAMPVKPAADTVANAEQRTQARRLALAFAGTALVSGALSAHLVSTLADLHFVATHAVWIASSIGVMQVTGRALELAVGTRLAPHALGAVTFTSMFVSLLLLLVCDVLPVAVLPFAILYGAANGVMTIVRAVIPLKIFGRHALGAILGRFAAPSLLTKSAAPWSFAMMQQVAGTQAAIAMMSTVALASLIAFMRAKPRTSIVRSPRVEEIPL